MADEELAQFDCPHCGRLFHWTPKLAGRLVRCPCGAELTCPEHPPVGPEPILEAIPLDPPPRAKAVVHTATAPAAPPTASSAAAEAPPVHKVNVRRVASPNARPKMIEPGVMRDQTIPLALLGFGVVVELIAVALTNNAGYMSGLIDLGENLGVQVLMMLLGMFAAAKIRHFTLGPFPTAVLKVLAVAVAVPAAILVLSPVLNAMCMGWIVSMLAALLAYFTLLGALFDLEEPDTFDCIGVIFFVYVLMYMFRRFVLHPV